MQLTPFDPVTYVPKLPTSNKFQTFFLKTIKFADSLTTGR